jgi:ubiquinone/menaquinone biosynthesis C-methylase UbiE
MPLPLADKPFDLVTGFNSLQYAGNPVVALKEARRVSKPERRIAIVTWGSQREWRLPVPSPLCTAGTRLLD